MDARHTYPSGRMPAEWEPQWGVQLTWPHGATDWAPYLEEITETFVRLADIIIRRENLLVVTPHQEEVKALLQARLPEDCLGRLYLVACPTDDTWARDHGFLSVRDADGSLRLLDFGFNGWGRKFGAALDNAVNRHVFNARILDGAYEDHLDFILEGGSVESDGRGTVLTTSTCLMAPGRNQPLRQAEIEERLKQYLRAHRVLWVDHGRLTGDDTDGHIDTIVRMAPENTLVYVGCDDTEDEQYHDLQALGEQLATLRTTEGKPYRLLRLPMPAPVCYDGERLPATYANYLVINSAVILPVYGQETADRQAAEILESAFPDREIIPVDARVIVRQHGSIHCLSMQYYAL